MNTRRFYIHPHPYPRVAVPRLVWPLPRILWGMKGVLALGGHLGSGIFVNDTGPTK